MTGVPPPWEAHHRSVIKSAYIFPCPGHKTVDPGIHKMVNPTHSYGHRHTGRNPKKSQPRSSLSNKTTERRSPLSPGKLMPHTVYIRSGHSIQPFDPATLLNTTITVDRKAIFIRNLHQRASRSTFALSSTSWSRVSTVLPKTGWTNWGAMSQKGCNTKRR